MRLFSPVALAVFLGGCNSSSHFSTSPERTYKHCNTDRDDWTLLAGTPPNRSELLALSLYETTVAEHLDGTDFARRLGIVGATQREAWFSHAVGRGSPDYPYLLVCRYSVQNKSCNALLAEFDGRNGMWALVYLGMSVAYAAR